MSKVSRNVANFTEIKNQHAHEYGVKEFVCLSVYLSVTRFDLNYLWTGRIIQIAKKLACVIKLYSWFFNAYTFKTVTREKIRFIACFYTTHRNCFSKSFWYLFSNFKISTEVKTERTSNTFLILFYNNVLAIIYIFYILIFLWVISIKYNFLAKNWICYLFSVPMQYTSTENLIFKFLHCMVKFNHIDMITLQGSIFC